LGLRDGVLCVKSPKGSGKTEQLENIVREAKERKLSVLLLGHRRSLLQSMSRRLGLTCYFTSEADLTARATPSLDMKKGRSISVTGQQWQCRQN
jgi:predicted transcriptional regulator of viral defense system